MISLRDILELKEKGKGNLEGIAKLPIFPLDEFEVEGVTYVINKIENYVKFEAVKKEGRYA